MPSYPRLVLYKTHFKDDIIGDPPASLVCHHWRNVVLTTPTLWTDIRVSSRALSEDGKNPHGDFISTQLKRSGICSLNVEFRRKVSPASLQLAFMRDLLKQVHRIQRLSISLTSANDDIRMWTANAQRLEILEIQAPRGRSDTFIDPSLLSDIQTPRLQTLMVSNYERWQVGNFRTLRHLLLEFNLNTPLVDLARKLMPVFALNAHTLEDLVVSDLSAFLDAKEQATEGASVVDMPALKRLSVSGASWFHDVLEPKLVLHDCARDYQFLSSRPIGISNRFPLKKLFMSYRYTIGTNGTAAVRSPYYAGLERPFSAFIDERDVQELWVGIGWEEGCHLTFGTLKTILRPTCEVRKLVLLRDARLWLSQFARLNCFPSLSELQIHSHLMNCYPAILDLVTGRKECGQAIETLRFVCHPYQNLPTYALREFDQQRSLLESYVANVVFDDVPEGSKPPRMELPAVCLTKSPVHSYWDPWEIY
ncbi:hypothetical protein BDW22DRAFT_929282 [Trametopsis cervina]|nr:hypothetical protein BDW22DRAFT_929282 [Trametopsis cervina]